MLEKYNKYKLLKIFLFSPSDSFRLRELSRLSKISPPSVMNYLREFEKKELIRRFKKRNIPYYQAIMDNENFVFYRKLAVLYELHSSGLIDYLWEELAPEAIILYGSYAKGEFIEYSDIDLFIIGKEKEINCNKFEEKLNARIHLMFEKEVKKIPKNLKNNLCNGIVLKGYFKVF
ncbi:MAG: nucleotidyltransferase domain-containing protein [Candidatus Pacearchaeota archaeon]|nr:MAG: nucleotidyltransferase domain-containing protein [Candidatus Pacearchaeota archaeon]